MKITYGLIAQIIELNKVYKLFKQSKVGSASTALEITTLKNKEFTVFLELLDEKKPLNPYRKEKTHFISIKILNEKNQNKGFWQSKELYLGSGTDNQAIKHLDNYPLIKEEILEKYELLITYVKHHKEKRNFKIIEHDFTKKS